MTSAYRRVLAVVLMFIVSNQLFGQQHLAPGVERWAIKTSLPSHPNRRTVPLKELLALPNPIDMEDSQFEAKRIPKTVGKHSLKEGDIITTTGWIHLVALEDDSQTNRDGDYHVQVRTSPAWADSCLIIEVPYAEFVSNKKLSQQCDAVRQFIKERMLNGKEPGTKGNRLDHPVYVTIKGQLFFDASHVKGEPRGKRNMKSYTPWELHPVYSIRFAAKPQ